MIILMSGSDSVRTTRKEERDEITEAEYQSLLLDAEVGDKDAQLSLGYYFLNEAEQKMKLFRSLPSGSPFLRAPYNINEKNPITEAADEDRKRAFNWFEKSANQGDPEAIYRLSVCYLYGEGTPTYERKAYKLLEKAAQLGQLEAQYDLGMLYLFGKKSLLNDSLDFPQDISRAVKWLTKAAEQNDSLAEYQLALYFEDQKEYSKAFDWYSRAAQSEYPCAVCKLGECYEKGLGTQKDFSRAAELYRHAAELDDTEGAYHLGRCYEEGIGVAADIDQAIACYQAAADQGYESAFDALERLQE